MKVTINGKDSDLTGKLPLNIGNWKKLKEAGVSIEAMKEGDWDIMSGVLLFVVCLGNKDITMDDIDTLIPTDPMISEIMSAMGGETKDLDRPS